MRTDLTEQRDPSMPVVEGLTGKLSSKTQKLEAPGISEGGVINWGLLTDGLYEDPFSHPGNHKTPFPPFFPLAEDQRRSLSWEID